MNAPLTFEGKSAVIVCHDSMSGPPHETLRDYVLAHKLEHLVFIGHVNQYVEGNPVTCSYVKIYKHGKIQKLIYAKERNWIEPVMYIHDVFLTIFWTFKFGRKPIDIFIGLANINAFVGIILSWFFIVKIPIYYVIDYIPIRFSNKILNGVYHILDYFCASFAKTTWNYGKGMIEARQKKWNKEFKKQLVTPHGVIINNKIIRDSMTYNPFELVYLGTLYEQQGLQLLIQALPSIKKIYPKTTITVIGLGPYKKTLEKFANSLKVTQSVHFLGYIKNIDTVDEIISRCALGIATYKNEIGFVVYTEPGKVKRYLSCGVPVIITRGTPLAEELSVSRCGIVCEYKVLEVEKRIEEFLANKSVQTEFRRNSVTFAKKYTWENIYTRAFLKTL